MATSASEPQATPLILVVDDDRSTRTLLRDTLQEQGFAVAEVANGIEALAAHERLRPSLVVLDLHMPEPDGFSVCRSIRERHPTDPTPILVVTADGDPASIDRAYRAGATDFAALEIALSDDDVARTRALLRSLV